MNCYRLVLLAIVGVLFVAACGSGDKAADSEALDDLEARVAALEDESQIGNLIVTGKEINVLSGVGLEGCVRYRIFDMTDETCVLMGVGTSREALTDCYTAIKIADPLPECWRLPLQ